MLIFIKEKLVVFSIPRTGSTSLHKALRPFADIEFSNPPTKKHMNVRRFDRWALENHRRFLRFTRVAVMREPLARMASWYAYRRRDAVRGSSASTRGMTFDQFIEGALSDTPTPATNIGNQHHFVTREDGSLGIHELFCIEKPEVMLAFFEKRFGPLTFP
ncbi:MAG: sulfotransferase family 2 domain-containing protein, partial [Pseudomonadota bacterium]